MDVYVSVPSRGNGVIDLDRYEVKEWMDGKFWVSVPSRGNGVIDSNDALANMVICENKFPSPLGEMGLSIRQKGPIMTASKTFKFPSPLGEMGLSI